MIFKVGNLLYQVETADQALMYAAAIVRRQSSNWPPFGTECLLLGKVEAELQNALESLQDALSPETEALLAKGFLDVQEGRVEQLDLNLLEDV